MMQNPCTPGVRASASLPSCCSAEGAGGRQINYLRLILPIWNETVAEYAKRGPTNRSNPYPAPGGLARLGQGKALQTYGCSHLGNPQLIPVVGAGPPACDAQGAVTIAGRTAQFRRCSAPRRRRGGGDPGGPRRSGCVPVVQAGWVACDPQSPQDPCRTISCSATSKATRPATRWIVRSSSSSSKGMTFSQSSHTR
jgi:hypothetical protein